MSKSEGLATARYGDYILEAVDSIRKQTYPNIELIIIDDGSDDKKTTEIINNIEKDIQNEIEVKVSSENQSDMEKLAVYYIMISNKNIF